MRITIFGLSKETFKSVTRLLSVSWYDDIELGELGGISVQIADDTKMNFLGCNEISLSLGDNRVVLDRSEYEFIKIE